MLLSTTAEGWDLPCASHWFLNTRAHWLRLEASTPAARTYMSRSSRPGWSGSGIQFRSIPGVMTRTWRSG